MFSDLHKFEFDDLPLNDDQTVLASVRMFRDSGLTATFRIDEKVSFILCTVSTCSLGQIVFCEKDVHVST